MDESGVTEAQERDERRESTSEHPELDRAHAEVAAAVGALAHPAENVPLDHAAWEQGQRLYDQAVADRDALAWALRKRAALAGVNVGEVPHDCDATAVSPEYRSLVTWAKTAR